MSDKPKRKRGQPLFSSFVQADMRHFGLGMVLGVLGLVIGFVLLVICSVPVLIEIPSHGCSTTCKLLTATHISAITQTVSAIETANDYPVVILYETADAGTQYAMMTQTATTPTAPEQPR